MLELIRFTSGSHAEEFMAGRLYMNSLGFFWNNGFEGQRDMLEGVAQMQDPKNSLFSAEHYEEPYMLRIGRLDDMGVSGHGSIS